MHTSKYTFLFTGNESEFYVYNSLSNSLISIDENAYQTLEKQKDNLSETDFDKEIYEILVDKRFICENERDEFLVYKSILNQQRNSTNFAHITIAPAMDCNFRCHYCFEKKSKTYLSPETIDNIIKYIDNQKDINKIQLTWFGGEPLASFYASSFSTYKSRF